MTTITDASSPVLPACKHKICLNLALSGAKLKTGVSTVVHSGNTIILGKVGLGWKYGSLAVCSGKFDSENDNCWLETAIRELREEFKITAAVGRFECAALVNGAIVLLYNCLGYNLAEMRGNVMAAHQKARDIIKLPNDDACRRLKYHEGEPREVSLAAANGEMQTLVCIMYSENIRLNKDILPFCITNICAMMKWKIQHTVEKYTRIVWSS